MTEKTYAVMLTHEQAALLSGALTDVLDHYNTEGQVMIGLIQEALGVAIRKGPTLDGLRMITNERQRQMAVEGWTPEHDDTHHMGELSMAAHAYAEVSSAMCRGATAEEFDGFMMVSEGDWPFDADSWKPSAHPIRNLVKAGALIAAEIDRLVRMESRP